LSKLRRFSARNKDNDRLKRQDNPSQTEGAGKTMSRGERMIRLHLSPDLPGKGAARSTGPKRLNGSGGKMSGLFPGNGATRARQGGQEDCRFGREACARHKVTHVD